MPDPSTDTEVQPAELGPKQIRKIVDRFRVTDGADFKLKHYATDDPLPDIVDKSQAKALLQQGVQRLSDLQELLYANASWSLLIVFQAMDAAGKDGTIKHVMSGVNPQGIQVTSFKAPGPEDLAHDFLWRINRALPARGMIGIFNRSHYEEVLVTRVHPDILEKQGLPPSLIDGKKFWDHRLKDIAGFERHLARQGTIVLKFFLNVGRDEQKKRFLERLDHPDKNWKFDIGDLKERGYWTDYMAAYEEAIAATATEQAPWFVVPADQKWFMRLVIVAAINDALEALALKTVMPTDEQVASFAEARRRLEQEP
ncbi:polyphosphate kinase 2 family protein [Lichenihabitans psoromatis]|uniref:polyphosphate kinase 2 family protein n=1 Tax=Lichenihabitans psoromatis TaxID=2528642 RepID=UPI001036D39C|nr:polyphosphate kinase 2 family protein [Lichenihabitans psoromatis]